MRTRASHRAVADLKGDGELPKRVVVRSSKYLNNLIEQDHRRIKQRLRPMFGPKKLSDGGHCDQRYRTGGEDQEGAVQDGQAGRAPGDTA